MQLLLDSLNESVVVFAMDFTPSKCGRCCRAGLARSWAHLGEVDRLSCMSNFLSLVGCMSDKQSSRIQKLDWRLRIRDICILGAKSALSVKGRLYAVALGFVSLWGLEA